VRAVVNALGVSGALVFGVACSNSSGGAPPVQSACYAQCAAQAKATGCPPGGSPLSDCQSACDSILASLPSSCVSKAQAAWTCGSNQSWECVMEGGVPTAEGTACAAQDKAFDDCSLGSSDE
jgi:hypothetical protein